MVGLKNLANTKVSVFGAIYLTFGRHIIYNLNKYNINVPTCYTNVYLASNLRSGAFFFFFASLLFWLDIKG